MYQRTIHIQLYSVDQHIRVISEPLCRALGEGMRDRQQPPRPPPQRHLRPNRQRVRRGHRRRTRQPVRGGHDSGRRGDLNEHERQRGHSQPGTAQGGRLPGEAAHALTPPRL